VDAGEDVAGELAEVAREYEEGLPRVEMTRCPYTSIVMRHTFDAFGLDGLWWNFESPARPLQERLYTCQSVTGAVALAAPLEEFPFLAKPGPGAPYVMPELFEREEVRAVVSSLRCGRHTAYCVAYFAPDEVDGVRWPNDWGLGWRWSEGGKTASGWYDAGEPEPAEMDFDLRPYLESGKLLWIAPGDEAMALRRGASGCPYVGLGGERRWQRVSMGKVWFEDDLSAEALEDNES
jgi:hypothetical protein